MVTRLCMPMGPLASSLVTSTPSSLKSSMKAPAGENTPQSITVPEATGERGAAGEGRKAWLRCKVEISKGKIGKGKTVARSRAVK